MLKDYLEPYELLKPCHLTEIQQPSVVFQAGVLDQAGAEQSYGGLAHLRTVQSMIHEQSVMLHLHDRVRRVRDGEVFCVLGESSDQCTPAIAGQSYACVPVEKVVTAP